MKLTREQFAGIKHLIPAPRKEPAISNYDFLYAILYLIENGRKWRVFPEKYVNWHIIYVKNIVKGKKKKSKINDKQNKNV